MYTLIKNWKVYPVLEKNNIKIFHYDQGRKNLSLTQKQYYPAPILYQKKETIQINNIR